MESFGCDCWCWWSVDGGCNKIVKTQFERWSWEFSLWFNYTVSDSVNMFSTPPPPSCVCVFLSKCMRSWSVFRSLSSFLRSSVWLLLLLVFFFHGHGYGDGASQECTHIFYKCMVFWNWMIWYTLFKKAIGHYLDLKLANNLMRF